MNNPNTIKIKAVSYYSDGGDGGGSITIYNSLEELRKDRFEPDDWTTPEECETKFQSALDRDDSYEDGAIDDVTLVFEPNADGSFRLAVPIHLHYGQ